jgi:hypothetical protein
MKITGIHFLFFSVMVTGLALPTALRAQGRSEPILRWEYRVLKREQVLEVGKKDLSAGLNALGNEGWELAGIDGVYIFKRPRDLIRNRVAELKSQVALIEADVEQFRDALAWTERMLKKGFMAASQVDFERSRLRRAEAALDSARREFEAYSAESKQAHDKERKPGK